MGKRRKIATFGIIVHISFEHPVLHNPGQMGGSGAGAVTRALLCTSVDLRHYGSLLAQTATNGGEVQAQVQALLRLEWKGLAATCQHLQAGLSGASQDQPAVSGVECQQGTLSTLSTQRGALTTCW